jgi:hypothetical protein
MTVIMMHFRSLVFSKILSVPSRELGRSPGHWYGPSAHQGHRRREWEPAEREKEIIARAGICTGGLSLRSSPIAKNVTMPVGPGVQGGAKTECIREFY